MIMAEDMNVVALEAGVGTVMIGPVAATWIANQVDVETFCGVDFETFCIVLWEFFIPQMLI